MESRLKLRVTGPGPSLAFQKDDDKWNIHCSWSSFFHNSRAPALPSDETEEKESRLVDLYWKRKGVVTLTSS